MISILIPTYHNSEEQLERLAESLKRIKSPNEILVCIDDNDPQYVKLVQKHFKHTIIQQNSGTFQARKTLVSKAKGDWVFFIDADDEATEALVETVNTASFSNAYAYYKTKCEIKGENSIFSRATDKTISDKLKAGDSGVMWGKFINRDILRNIYDLLPNYKYKLWFGEEIPPMFYLEKLPNTNLDVTTIKYYDEGASAIKPITTVDAYKDFLTVIQIMSYYGKEYTIQLITQRLQLTTESIRPECVHLYRRAVNKIDRMDEYIKRNMAFKTIYEIDEDIIEKNIFCFESILQMKTNRGNK